MGELTPHTSIPTVATARVPSQLQMEQDLLTSAPAAGMGGISGSQAVGLPHLPAYPQQLQQGFLASYTEDKPIGQ